MSEKNPSDVKLNENPNGTVSFATEVVATIAGLAATEVDGVASMISPSSGLADMFSRKSNRNLTKGVRIDLEDNMVSADITITVEYGSPVPDVAHNIQENVKKAIETMSGLDVKSVDVHVTGISFEREQRANAELDEQHRKLLEKTEEAAAEKAADEKGEETPKGEEPVNEAPVEEELPEEDELDDEDDFDDELEDEYDIEDDEEETEVGDDAEDEEPLIDEAEDEEEAAAKEILEEIPADEKETEDAVEKKEADAE